MMKHLRKIKNLIEIYIMSAKNKEVLDQIRRIYDEFFKTKVLKDKTTYDSLVKKLQTNDVEHIFSNGYGNDVLPNTTTDLPLKNLSSMLVSKYSKDDSGLKAFLKKFNDVNSFYIINKLRNSIPALLHLKIKEGSTKVHYKLYTIKNNDKGLDITHLLQFIPFIFSDENTRYFETTNIESMDIFETLQDDKILSKKKNDDIYIIGELYLAERDDQRKKEDGDVVKMAMKDLNETDPIKLMETYFKTDIEKIPLYSFMQFQPIRLVLNESIPYHEQNILKETIRLPVMLQKVKRESLTMDFLNKTLLKRREKPLLQFQTYSHPIRYDIEGFYICCDKQLPVDQSDIFVYDTSVKNDDKIDTIKPTIIPLKKPSKKFADLSKAKNTDIERLVSKKILSHGEEIKFHDNSIATVKFGKKGVYLDFDNDFKNIEKNYDVTKHDVVLHLEEPFDDDGKFWLHKKSFTKKRYFMQGDIICWDLDISIKNVILNIDFTNKKLQMVPNEEDFIFVDRKISNTITDGLSYWNGLNNSLSSKDIYEDWKGFIRLGSNDKIYKKIVHPKLVDIFTSKNIYCYFNHVDDFEYPEYSSLKFYINDKILHPILSADDIQQINEDKELASQTKKLFKQLDVFFEPSKTMKEDEISKVIQKIKSKFFKDDDSEESVLYYLLELNLVIIDHLSKKTIQSSKKSVDSPFLSSSLSSVKSKSPYFLNANLILPY